MPTASKLAVLAPVTRATALDGRACCRDRRTHQGSAPGAAGSELAPGANSERAVRSSRLATRFAGGRETAFAMGPNPVLPRAFPGLLISLACQAASTPGASWHFPGQRVPVN